MSCVNEYMRFARSHMDSPSLPPQVLSAVVSVPVGVTLAGVNGTKTVVLWSLDTTKSVLNHLPVKTYLNFIIKTFIGFRKTLL